MTPPPPRAPATTPRWKVWVLPAVFVVAFLAAFLVEDRWACALSTSENLHPSAASATPRPSLKGLTAAAGAATGTSSLEDSASAPECICPSASATATATSTPSPSRSPSPSPSPSPPLAHVYPPFRDPEMTIADGVTIASLAKVWKDCSKGIYLDVGSNVGVQVRKLFDPESFPGAPVHGVFRVNFGADRSQVCAVGFEPNPAHTEYLNTVNENFAARGKQGLILTEVAVASKRGTAEFFLDTKASPQHHEWGASLASWQSGAQSVKVPLLPLADFILQVVAPIVATERARTGRTIPVLMKVDIEGAEFDVMPALILSGALCHVNAAFVEWHDAFRASMPNAVDMKAWDLRHSVELMAKVYPVCKIHFIDLDDETFADGTAIPLPPVEADLNRTSTRTA